MFQNFGAPHPQAEHYGTIAGIVSAGRGARPFG